MTAAAAVLMLLTLEAVVAASEADHPSSIKSVPHQRSVATSPANSSRRTDAYPLRRTMRSTVAPVDLAPAPGPDEVLPQVNEDTYSGDPLIDYRIHHGDGPVEFLDAESISAPVAGGCATGAPCHPNCHGDGLFGGIKRRWHCQVKPWLQRTHWGYPEEFYEAPLGYYLSAHMGTQIDNGQRARLVLYHFDFHQVERRDELTLRGLEQLERLFPLLLYGPYPLVIEAVSDNAALGRARFEHVVQQLEQMGLPAASDRVVIGRPLTRGRFGPEASEIDLQMRSGVPMIGGPSGPIAPAVPPPPATGGP